MAITVRQLKEKLAAFPPELDDEEVVVTGKVGDGPDWMYEIGLPSWYNGPAVCIPIIRLTRPITQAMIDSAEDPRVLQKMVDSGEWPFEAGSSENESVPDNHSSV